MLLLSLDPIKINSPPTGRTPVRGCAKWPVAELGNTGIMPEILPFKIPDTNMKGG
jgi:hypothetical protein